jgi:hypothetical protein
LRTFDDLQLALERAAGSSSAGLRVVRANDERELAIDLTGEPA